MATRIVETNKKRNGQLDDLCNTLALCKEYELKAIEARREAEAELLGFIKLGDELQEPGTIRVVGEHLGVELVIPVTYKADVKKLYAELPKEQAQRITLTKIEFSKSGYNQLEKSLDADPEDESKLQLLRKVFGRWVEPVIGKPSVKVFKVE